MAEKMDIKVAQDYLGEPFALDFSDYTRKVRNNLMFVGILSIILITQDLVLSDKSSLLGLKFDGLDMDLIFKILLVLDIYLMIHFIWLTWDTLIKWRLRLTGSHKKYEGGFADDISDSKPDPSQTTLYYWWLRQAQTIDRKKSDIVSIEEWFKKHSIRLTEKVKDGEPGVSSLIDGVRKDIEKLNASINKYSEIISNTRIPASLERFDKTFHHFKSSQNLRWIFIEILTPVIIGGYSLILLLQKLYA